MGYHDHLEVHVDELAQRAKNAAVEETMDEYLGNPATGASQLKEMVKSAAHYKWRYIDHPDEDDETPSKEFGTIVHKALLEPASFRENMRIAPDFGKGEGSRKRKWAWEEEIAAQPGVFSVTQEEADAIMLIVAQVKQHRVAESMFTKGIPEHSFYFTDPDHSMPCKFRPDVLTEDGWIVNVKTTRDASREGFTREIGQHRYDIGAGFYTWGYKTLFNQDPQGYVFIAIENKGPYCTAVYVADDTIIDKGRADAQRALHQLKLCRENNRYPGYQDGEAQNISLPQWMLFEE